MFDEKLASRIRKVLEDRGEIVERRMFGGLAFLRRGHMCCGILGDQLMVRVGPESHEDALSQPYTRPMDFTGRPMRGMIYVSPEGLRTEKALRHWVDRGLQFVGGLPEKKNRPRR